MTAQYLFFFSILYDTLSNGNWFVRDDTFVSCVCVQFQTNLSDLEFLYIDLVITTTIAILCEYRSTSL